VPESASGFHRIGFYSNVDARFLPMSARSTLNHVGIYVERAYLPGQRPSKEQEATYIASSIRELQKLQFITDVDVIDPTWIEVAYTWSWPKSTWRQTALQALQKHGIFQVGRYGRWVFQGIADSLRDGFVVGSSFATS
jgi:hypothetical protein